MQEVPWSTDVLVEGVISESTRVLIHATFCPAETVCLAVDLKPENITVIAMCPGDAAWALPWLAVLQAFDDPMHNARGGP